MIRAVRLCLPAVLAFIAVFSCPAKSSDPAGVVAQGTPAETPYYLIDSGRPGPRLAIISGVHGDELAGPYAAEQIRHWSITRGSVLILPQANVLALKANSRLSPLASADPPSNTSSPTNDRSAKDSLTRNLNRAFPPSPDQARALPGAIWSWLKEMRPDWLLDLHEGAKFHIEATNSVGSTVIPCRKPQAVEVGRLIVSVLNQSVEATNHKFLLLHNPIKGSIARAAADELGIRSMIIETAQERQSLALRARQHRIAVHTCLEKLGLITPGETAGDIMPATRKQGRIAVAVYDGPGTSGSGVPLVLRQIGSHENMIAARVCAGDIQAGALKNFDVVMFTGGSGSGQGRALGESGRGEVREFVREGGGYIGICAGSYLACSGFEWGLGLLNARTVSPLWQRGKGRVEVELTEVGLPVLGGPGGTRKWLYAQGPIVGPAAIKTLPAYDVFAWFRSEMAANNTPKGIMVNSPAVFAGSYGNGRALCFSPHPEQTDGFEEFIPRAVEWACYHRINSASQ